MGRDTDNTGCKLWNGHVSSILVVYDQNDNKTKNSLVFDGFIYDGVVLQQIRIIKSRMQILYAAIVVFYWSE